jgi:hypothetical protein
VITQVRCHAAPEMAAIVSAVLRLAGRPRGLQPQGPVGRRLASLVGLSDTHCWRTSSGRHSTEFIRIVPAPANGSIIDTAWITMLNRSYGWFGRRFWV